MNGKILLLGALLASTLPAVAQEPTDAQLAKRDGLLVGVAMKSLPNAQLSDTAKAYLDMEIDGAPGCKCGYPHSPDPELAFASIEELQAGLGLSEEDARCWRHMHRSSLAQLATGSGAFPAGCDPKRPGVHVIKWYINPSNFNPVLKRPLTDAEFQGIIDAKVWGPSGDPRQRPFTMAELKAEWGGKPMWQVNADFVIEGNRRIGLIQDLVVTGFNNIETISRYIPGSVIGVGWYPSAAPCPGDSTEFHVDTSYEASHNYQVGLWFHEDGHAIGCPHTFQGQDRGQWPMSYRYNNHPFYGWITPDVAAITGLPVDASLPLLTKLYGGKPVGEAWGGRFKDVTDPDPPITPGDGNGWTVGHEFTVHDGKLYTLRVVKVEGDEGLSLSDKVKAAAATVDYLGKDSHQPNIASLYASFAKAVSDGAMTVEQAHEGAKWMRDLLLRRDADEWAPVWELADDVTTADGFLSVSRGLGGASGASITSAEAAAMLLWAQGNAANASPDLLNIIKLVLPILTLINPELGKIVGIILALLENFAAEPDAPPAPAQKPEENVMRKWKAPFVPFGEEDFAALGV